MDLELKRFRRPFSIAVSCEGMTACLIRPSETRILLISNSGQEILSKDIRDLGLESALSLCLIDSSQIVILDHISGNLAWFDLNLNHISSIKLPGHTYGVMRLCGLTNKIYISVLDISEVIQVTYGTKKLCSTILDYSNIEAISDVDGLVFYEADSLFVIDKKRSSLVFIKLEADGPSVKKFLSHGREGFGKVRFPTDINIVGESIVIHDTDNYLIQVFDKNINFLFQIGGKGDGVGKFDLAICGYVRDSNLYICDQNNDRIVRINFINLELVVEIKDKFYVGSLCRPSGVSVHKNKVFVADRSNGVIQVFDEKLNYLNTLIPNNRKLHRPSSISIVENNKIAIAIVVERKSGLDSTLTLYRLLDDSVTMEYINTITIDVAFNDPQDISVGPSSDIYIADTLNRRILRVGLDGQVFNAVDMVQISGNETILIKTISVRSDGDVFTADFDACTVYHFDGELKIKAIIDFSVNKPDISVLRGIFALTDVIILCVRGLQQVLVSDYNGKIISSVDCLESTKLNWKNPVKIARSEKDLFYIADKENDRVLCFNAELSLVGTSDKLIEK
jgi:sugar lactone lactonase YvrE